MRSTVKKIILALLQWEARAVVRKYKPSIIAITGSVGKTSTKDAIYAALAEHASVRKSEKSFNSDIGMPLTILGVPNAWDNPLRWLQNLFDGLALILLPAPYPKWLVLEVGADRPGDIRSVAAWLPCDIVVITRLPEMPVHVEYFESPEEVVEEKASLIHALKPSGTLVLYGDDPRVLALRERARERRVITFGFDAGADVQGENASVLYDEAGEPLGIRVDITSNGIAAQAKIPGVVGTHALMPLLAACAVVRSLDVPVGEAVSSFEKHFSAPQGRMRLLRGINSSTIIDDSYNASPAAVSAALETLGSLEVKGRTIAALGDMLELGRYSVDEHRKAGAIAAKNTDMLLTVGFRARDMSQAALDNGMPESNILQFEDARRAGKELRTLIQPGDCILIKGSQSMRMERIAEALLADPSEAKNVLVRQDKEWSKR